jgi:CHAD domain-containing protein
MTKTKEAGAKSVSETSLNAVPTNNTASPAQSGDTSSTDTPNSTKADTIFPPMAMGSSMAEAGRLLLANQLQKLHKAQKVIETGPDPDAIHDMRVATRRLNTAFKILENTVYDPAVTKAWRRGLRKLLNNLSEARDTDVFIEHLTNYKASLPADQQTDLNPLVEKLEQKRAAAQIHIEEILQKHKLHQLLADLAEFTGKPGAGVLDASSHTDRVAPSLVRHFVASALWQHYEVILAYQTQLTVGTDFATISVETLHQLRIALKHFRYTLEFFSEALPATSQSLIEQVTAGQDYLGELHDHDVAVKESNLLLAKHPAYLALQAYRDTRVKQRDELHAHFGPKWQSLSSKAFRQKLGTLLA